MSGPYLVSSRVTHVCVLKLHRRCYAESLGEQSASDVSVQFTLILNQHVLLSDELEQRISTGSAKKKNEANAKLAEPNKKEKRKKKKTKHMNLIPKTDW